MKLEMRTILGAAFFLGIVTLIYWATSTESTGTALLLFSFAAYSMLGGYLLLQWRRRHGVPRMEDREDGNYQDVAGEHLGFFPAASIWPAGLGLGAIFVAVALIFGNWYFIIGLPLMLGSVIGWSVESEAPEDVEDEAQAAHRQDAAVAPSAISDAPAHQ